MNPWLFQVCILVFPETSIKHPREDSEWPDKGHRPFSELSIMPKERESSGPLGPLGNQEGREETKLIVTTSYDTLKLL